MTDDVVSLSFNFRYKGAHKKTGNDFLLRKLYLVWQLAFAGDVYSFGVIAFNLLNTTDGYAACRFFSR